MVRYLKGDLSQGRSLLLGDIRACLRSNETPDMVKKI